MLPVEAGQSAANVNDGVDGADTSLPSTASINTHIEGAELGGNGSDGWEPSAPSTPSTPSGAFNWGDTA
jgi:hypothetical protein